MVVKHSYLAMKKQESGEIIDLQPMRGPTGRTFYPTSHTVKPAELPVEYSKSNKSHVAMVLSSVVLIGLFGFLIETSGALKESTKSTVQRYHTQISVPVVRPLPLSIKDSVKDLGYSMERMGEEMRQRQALAQLNSIAKNPEKWDELDIEQKSYLRDLIVRAGYRPNGIAMLDTTKSKDLDDDIHFATGVAKDVVKENIESFLHNVFLVTRVGEYVAERIDNIDK